ncbi:MAG: DUF3300 domain-containing protein [Fibrobacter sp.]|nr:DUF3300 domain-containing protein [Fibrobacter sp.]
MMKLASMHLFMRWTWLALALSLLFSVSARAVEKFSDSELDTLVATIALYPDPLLDHVLAASTYGDQIIGANSWSQAHKNLSGEGLAQEMERAQLPYAPSVLALIPFPTVLATMAKYKTWSDQLGYAVSMQKADVMESVQRLRKAAYDHGQLKSDEQVLVEKGVSITIEPVRTEYVYVPVYNPWVVYYVFADYPSIRYRHYAWLGPWYGDWGWGPRPPRRHTPPPRHHETPRREKHVQPPPGPVFQSDSRWERVSPPSRQEPKPVEYAKPSAPAGSFNASSGNSVKRRDSEKREESSTEYREENSNFGNYSRKPAPSSPSGSSPSGGFRKSKRR